MYLVITLFLTLIVAFYLAGLKEWSLFLSLVFLSLGIGEYISVKIFGITLSERFYRFTKKNKLVAIALSLLLITSIFLIVYHLWTLWG